MFKAEFRKPDVTAPRFRRTRYNVLSDKFLEKFLKKYPKYEGTITLQEIRRIVRAYNTQLWSTVIKERDGVEFPEGLGFIFIGTCPSPYKKYNTDFGTSRELESRVRHRNFESDNFLCKIFYTNFANKYKFQHREVWQFKATRDFSRAVAHSYPEHWKKYLQVDNFVKISRLYRRHLNKNYARQNNEDIPDTYNEFEID